MFCSRVELREHAHLLPDRECLYILVCHRLPAGETHKHTDWHKFSYNEHTLCMWNFGYLFIFPSQNYAESLCRSFCDLLKDITNEGQVQVLKVLSLHPSHSQLNHFCLFSVSIFSGFIFSSSLLKLQHRVCLLCLGGPANSRCTRSAVYTDTQT